MIFLRLRCTGDEEKSAERSTESGKYISIYIICFQGEIQGDLGKE